MYVCCVCCVHPSYIYCVHTIVEERLDLQLHKLSWCCVVYQLKGCVGLTLHPLTLLFFLLCMCHGAGEYAHTKQCLKLTPLTASIQFIPVWNQLEHRIPLLDHVSVHSHNHTLTHSHTMLITCTCCYDLTKGPQDNDFSYSFFDSHSCISGIFRLICFSWKRAYMSGVCGSPACT